MRPLIVTPEEGKTVHAFGDTITFKMIGEQCGNDLSIGHATVPPGGGPPLHIHHREHEVFLTISGDLEALVDGEWRKAPPGSVVFLPRDVPHQFRNAGDTPSTHWVICSPGGGFEKFFERAAEIWAMPGPPDFGLIKQAAEEHGMELVGRPPEPQ